MRSSFERVGSGGGWARRPGLVSSLPYIFLSLNLTIIPIQTLGKTVFSYHTCHLLPTKSAPKLRLSVETHLSLCPLANWSHTRIFQKTLLKYWGRKKKGGNKSKSRIIDDSHEIKIMLLGRKAMTNLDSMLRSRDITLPTKVLLVKAMGFSNSHVWMRVGL